MKTIRDLKKRSGFTLVELLIVIIIIGILAGAMMMLAGSGTDRAEATKIISDLRGLKAAALMYYADHGGDTVPPVNHATSPDLAEYMDRTVGTGYTTVGVGSEWYVGYDVPAGGIRTSLTRSAAESGLLGTATGVNPTAGYSTVYNTHERVWMRAR